jgi:triacylglycerol lipase
MLARSLAARRPDLVASVVTLGSPFRGIRSHPLVLAASRRVREWLQAANRPDCYTGHCRCEAVRGLERPIPASIPTLAVSTRTDGIVDWRMCVGDDPAGNVEVPGTHVAGNVEVPGTHVALVANPAVYRALARHLADAGRPVSAATS